MRNRILLLCLVTFMVFANDVLAQKVKKSQKAGLSQTIAKTEITITYYRPVARDRALFGELVPYDEVWQPGANDATIFEVNRDIEIEGQKLAAGKYSLWSIPGESQWTFIFNSKWDVWHTKYPKGKDVLRVEVAIQEATHMETLAYYFPYIEGKEGTLAFHWGTTVVPIKIKQID